MELNIETEERLKEYIKESNKLFDRICEGELALFKVREIIEQSTDYLNIIWEIFLFKNTAKYQSKNSKRIRNMNNNHKKVKSWFRKNE